MATPGNLNDSSALQEMLRFLRDDELTLIAADAELKRATLETERRTTRVEALKTLIEVLRANPIPVTLEDLEDGAS